MGSGYRGNFGPTKGSKTIPLDNSDKVIAEVSSIGKIKWINNNKLYNNYREEPRVTFRFVDESDASIQICEKYINDIMNHQPGTEDDFKYGLSYDWYYREGPYSIKKNNIINVDDYIKDLVRFKKMYFKYEKTKEVYELILLFLKNAKNNNKKVEVIVD